MAVRSISALVLLVALSGCGQRQGTAQQEPPAKAYPVRYDVAAADAGPRCAAGEHPVYVCPFKQKTVSVCATDRAVTYRYGPPGKTDLKIASNGSDGRAHLGTARGPGNGGEQTSLRFSNGGYEYIIYSAIGGTGTAVPGRHWSGLVVMKGAQEISSVQCPVSGKAQQFTLDTAPSFVADEDNPDYQAWF